MVRTHKSFSWAVFADLNRIKMKKFVDLLKGAQKATKATKPAQPLSFGDRLKHLSE